MVYMKFIKSIKRYCLLALALLPSRVPQGRTEFESWASSIISLYGFPDNDSVRFALATMIMHDGPTAAYRPKFRYALMIKAGASKQVASAVFQDIKLRQAEAIKAAAEAATANEQQKS